MGEHGNVINAKLQFSNNPNTLRVEKMVRQVRHRDNVIVFTYKAEINKVNENLQPLFEQNLIPSKKLVDGNNKRYYCSKEYCWNFLYI